MSHIVKIISERQSKQHIEWRREFQRIGESEGTGYSFPCDQGGVVDTNDANYDCWKENYEYCLSHPQEYEDLGAVCNSWYYTEPAVGKCSCGREVRLQGDTVCECGQWYNQFGQALLDPEYWEEDDEMDII